MPATSWRPGWRFYEVVWKRHGEEILRHALHASDEADAIARGEAINAELIKRDQGDDLKGTTVEVRLLSAEARMPVSTPAQFINLDLVLKSKSDLSTIIKYFDEKAFVLHHEEY